MSQDLKPINKQYGITHMMLFEQLKSHLTNYKTIDELLPIAKVSRGFLIQRLLLLEDLNYLDSGLKATGNGRGRTKVYKLK
jgi:hypothetical protein